MVFAMLASRIRELASLGHRVQSAASEQDESLVVVLPNFYPVRRRTVNCGTSDAIETFATTHSIRKIRTRKD
jgi:hypothetical protein